MVVETGAAARNELAATRFDLVCSALHLPDMLGTALCATLRHDPRFSAMPFFLFTTDAGSDLQRQALPEGVTEVFHRNEVVPLFNYIAHYPFDDRQLSGRVLLVEDDASLRPLIGAMLLDHGLEVTACADADTAWPQFAAGSFDLVITDIVLTGHMSGLQLVRRIRRTNAPHGETPILAMTGFEDPARRLELFRAGINDYIAKPMIEAEFIARVDNLLLARQAMWLAMTRKVDDGLREIRTELAGPLATSLTPEQRRHVEAGARRAAEVEQSLNQSGPNASG